MNTVPDKKTPGAIPLLVLEVVKMMRQAGQGRA